MSDEFDHLHQEFLDRTGFWGAEGAGCLILSKSSGRFLVAKRSAFVLEPHSWGTWGGAIDPGDDLRSAVLREIEEETGQIVSGEGMEPVFVFEKPEFRYTTFVVPVDDEFEPVLNWESEDSAWWRLDEFSADLHYGLAAVLADEGARSRLCELASSCVSAPRL